MNAEILLLLFFFNFVRAPPNTINSNIGNKTNYPSIKFIMEGNTPYLLLSDEINPTEIQKLYWICPVDGIHDVAYPYIGPINDHCAKDYVPLFTEKFESCGQGNHGDLKTSSYMFKLNFNEEKFYKLNVFQMCISKNTGIPKFAFAAYNILTSSTTSNTEYDSLTIPENVKDLCKKETDNNKKTFNTEDTLIPQRLIPSKSIPHWFAKGAINTLNNLMPQWNGKITKWNRINEVIEQKAQNNEFSIITGVSNRPLNKFNPHSISKEALDHMPTIPRYWWTMIRNTSEKKGIILVMDNAPDQLSHEEKLCPPVELKNTIWQDIKENESDEFVYACHLTKELFRSLINLKENVDYSPFDQEILLKPESKGLRNLDLIFGWKMNLNKKTIDHTISTNAEH